MFVRSCARMQRVFLVVSDGSISGAVSFSTLFGSKERRWSLTIDVCMSLQLDAIVFSEIKAEFVVISVVNLLLLPKIVCFWCLLLGRSFGQGERRMLR